MKHTLGPWQVERGNVGATHPLFVVAPGKDGLRPWCDADAHLIAASPDLLDALKQMQVAAEEIAIEFIEHKRATNWKLVNDAHVAAARAIAKADPGCS
jgi:hypothetical protein